MNGKISEFIRTHFKHFNSAVVVSASEAYKKHVETGGKMMVTLAGAMSTAQLGKSLAEMIRQGKVHAITCTGANLEEDVFNLVARSKYLPVQNYRNLTADEEKALCDKGFNRVTDVCIPEKEAMLLVEGEVLKLWKKAEAEGVSKLPHEYMYELLLSDFLKDKYDADPKDSWLLAAAEKNLPIFVPGWEDSSLGNMFVAQHFKKGIKLLSTVKGGLHYMESLVNWYQEASKKGSIGFFQIGGGIAGDFPICVVPLLKQDMKVKDTQFWGYFCQISDSTTSYGSYSGAIPNEKITWNKLEQTTPRFVIESDATIVAPLIFAYVLGW